jgi:CRISPR-associated protein Cmr3
MKAIQQWILLEPLDTLFFRGSELMVAGENHDIRSIFPPVPETFMGAIRTAILAQRGIPINQFISLADPLSDYPLLGTAEKPNFQISGPIFQIQPLQGDMEWVVPAPAHWFAYIPDEIRDDSEIDVIEASPLPDDYLSIGLKGSITKPVWCIKPKSENMDSLSGHWVSWTAIRKIKSSGKLIYRDSVSAIGHQQTVFMKNSALFEFEHRVGIARENITGQAKTGHLYASTHVRLKRGVYLIIGLSHPMAPHYLDPSGVLQLGGEQRICHYKVIDSPPIHNNPVRSWVMALGTFMQKSLPDELTTCNFACNRITRMGGWDMKKKFHKPSTPYVSAGSVYFLEKTIEPPFGFI